jgi:hypothetical protein
MLKKTLLPVLGLIFALGASSSLLAQQYARPDTTGSTGTFTVVGAATHHQALNESFWA